MYTCFSNLDRIEFVVTLACTGRCKHCSEGDHPASGEHLDGALAAGAVTELSQRYQLTSLMVFGGEPLLYPDTVCHILEAGKRAGIPRRDLITNGFFTQNPTQIRDTAHRLALSGAVNVLLSVDAFHQETIPLEPVREFAACMKQEHVSISTHPAWLVHPSDENPYNRRTREILDEFQAMGIGPSRGNLIFPSGNAKKYLAAYFAENPPPDDPYEQDPKDIHTLSISPNGDLLHGNLKQQSILELIDAYDRSFDS